jgi:hypothetical protein
MSGQKMVAKIKDVCFGVKVVPIPGDPKGRKQVIRVDTNQILNDKPVSKLYVAHSNKELLRWITVFFPDLRWQWAHHYNNNTFNFIGHTQTIFNGVQYCLELQNNYNQHGDVKVLHSFRMLGTEDYIFTDIPSLILINKRDHHTMTYARYKGDDVWRLFETLSYTGIAESDFLPLPGRYKHPEGLTQADSLASYLMRLAPICTDWRESSFRYARQYISNVIKIYTKGKIK